MFAIRHEYPCVCLCECVGSGQGTKDAQVNKDKQWARIWALGVRRDKQNHGNAIRMDREWNASLCITGRGWGALFSSNL